MKEIPGRIPRFHLDGPLRAGGTCALPEDSAHHAIHVMRLRAGDDIVLFNGRGGEYAARISSIQKLQVSIDLLEHRAIERESPLRVVLLQGVSAGDRMDSTLRKAVELGVTEFQPLLTARSVARPKGERAAARQEHWQKVAIAACEQCGRNRIPLVHPLIEVSAYRPQGGEDSLKVLLSPRAQLRFSQSCKAGNSFTLAAGPEAGFSADEEAAFAALGFVPGALGPRVLRTETAALAALAALNALAGDF
jgi:16S rRNA (uracil1498-N3)-methyltransferase